MAGARAAAARTLAAVIADGEAFDPERSQPNGLEAQDRAFYRQLCFGTLRFYHRLDAQLKPLLKKPLPRKHSDVRALLLAAFYQLAYLRTPDHAAIDASVEAARELGKHWACGLVNAVLRNALRQGLLDRDPEDPAAAASHPAWLYQQLGRDWPQQRDAIIASNNSQAPMCLRVNLRQQDREDYQRKLEQQGIPSEPHPLVASGLLLANPVEVDHLPGFGLGAASVQDAGAQLAAALLAPGPSHRVLDACAAPGGKACHILEQAPGASLTVIDIDSKRLQSTRENLARCGLDAQLHCSDASDIASWWDGQHFDRILLDAPCSGTGVINRHPDIKLLRRASDLDRFANIQATLLDKLWQVLADDGELLYVTCSISPAENARLIAGFIAGHSDAQLLPIAGSWGIDTGYGRQLLPKAGENDGFFYARLSKRLAPSSPPA